MDKVVLRRVCIQVDWLQEQATKLKKEWKWNQINLAQRTALKILNLTLWGAFILFPSELSVLISKSSGILL